MKALNAKTVVLIAVFLFRSHNATALQGITPAADILHAHGIDTSEPSLIAALNNSDPQLRSLAAAQLTHAHDFQARSAVEKALSTETNTQARIGMASALANIGDPVGARHLESMCSDATLPVEVIVRAEREVAMAHSDRPSLTSPAKCANVILAAIETVSESYQRAELLTALASMVHEVPSDQASRMVADAQNLLQDKDANTRMRASEALADMGSTASIEAIRNAIQNESNPTARAFQQRNLDTLQKLQQPQ
jgi:HEAT repeat protein